MSLHLGNLSSRTRVDNLERVFRRFGPCNIRVKDRFGFVVYDFPANAEKALRTLRGKSICGEPITLSWSKQQPKPLQRERSSRFYEPLHGRNRNPGRESYISRKLVSDGYHGERKGFKQVDADGHNSSSADIPENPVNFDKDNPKSYNGEKDHNISEGLADESGGKEPITMDNVVWAEKPSDLSNANDLGAEFDRYQPYNSDDKKDVDEMYHAVPPSGLPVAINLLENAGGVQSSDTALNMPDVKPERSCYRCGELGHIMRACTRESATRPKRLSRFDRRRDNVISYRSKVEFESKRISSKSQDRQWSGRDVVMRADNSVREASSSRKHHRLSGRQYSPIAKQSGRSRRGISEEKKRRLKSRSPEKHHAKKLRPASTPIHSDYTASRSPSRSKSLVSASRSASHSRRSSASSSSSPTSSSTSRQSRTTSRSSSISRSRSRSRSSSSNHLSLSVPLGQPLPASPSVVHNHRDSLVKPGSPESKEVKPTQLVQGYTNLDSSKRGEFAVMEDDHMVAPVIASEYLENNFQNTEYDCSLEAMGNHDGKMSPLDGQTPVVDLGDHVSLETEQLLASKQNPESTSISSEFVSSQNTARMLNISSEEMLMVLKHCGLKHPEADENVLDAETYFGSSRFWPWQAIYYRRLRKGPISTENYARRIAQNKEFCIVDKYVRSSSGWGELGEDAC